MFIFGGALMICIALFVNLVFLGQAFTIMLVYVWSRRNPVIRMNFFGLMNFQAPYLPWVLLGFSLLLGNSVVVDILGIAVGHVYYFLEDVFPQQPGGFRILVTPGILKRILERGNEDADYEPMPEVERPGGFNFVDRDDGVDHRDEWGARYFRDKGVAESGKIWLFLGVEREGRIRKKIAENCRKLAFYIEMTNNKWSEI